MKNQQHPLSWEALTRIVMMGVIVFLLWKSLGAVTLIIIALVLSAALYPLVQIVHTKIKLPLLFSLMIVFLILLIPFIIIGVTIIPTLSMEFPELLTRIGIALNNIPFLSSTFTNFDISQYVQTNYVSVVTYSKDIMLAVVSIISVIVLTFYFIYDYKRLIKLFLGLFPEKEEVKIKEILGSVAMVTGQYIRGNILISLINIFIVAIGLLIIGVPFALPLAIFSGTLGLLPLVGASIGAVPALLIAFSISPVKAFFTLVLFLAYQQIENAVISPVVYNKALNLYPALTFLAVLIGASLFGILGAFLALPIAASIPVLIEYRKDYIVRSEIKEEEGLA